MTSAFGSLCGGSVLGAASLVLPTHTLRETASLFGGWILYCCAEALVVAMIL